MYQYWYHKVTICVNSIEFVLLRYESHTFHKISINKSETFRGRDAYFSIQIHIELDLGISQAILEIFTPNFGVIKLILSKIQLNLCESWWLNLIWNAWTVFKTILRARNCDILVKYLNFKLLRFQFRAQFNQCWSMSVFIEY